MEQGQTRLYYKLVAKVFLFILFAFLVSGIVISAVATQYLLRNNVFDGVYTYVQTEACKQDMKNTAFAAAQLMFETGDAAAVEATYSASQTNLSVTIRNYFDEEEIVYQNRVYETPIYKGTFYFCAAEADFFYSQVPQYNRTIYTVDYALGQTMEVDDVFRRGYNTFSYVQAVGEKWLVYAVVFAVLLIFDVVFLFAGTGHKDGVDGISLNYVDRVPLEILTAVIGTGIFVLASWSYDILFREYNTVTMSGLIRYGTSLFLLIMPILYLLLFWLMSVSARLKAGTWWSNTITWYVLHAVFTFLMMIPGIIKVVIVYAFISLFFLFAYEWRQPLMLIAGVVLAGVTILYCGRQAYKLKEAGEDLVDGVLDNDIDERYMIGGFKEHAENLRKIRHGVQTAVDAQIKSERLRTELITNVSHDIKTPLTSIINYVDLLKKPHSADEEEKYLDALSRNSRRLKKLTEDIVEASKASTGNIEAEFAPVNAQEMIDQAVGEYQDKFELAGLTAVVNVESPDMTFDTDGRLLWRVLSNLLSNCTKYALEGTRVYINAVTVGEKAEISIKNISKAELNISPDELMERFIRGDRSRSTEGSGLGLNIARSLVDILKGEFELQIDGDLFKAVIRLPLYVQTAEETENKE